MQHEFQNKVELDAAVQQEWQPYRDAEIEYQGKPGAARWPTLNDAALVGIVGDIVRAATECNEAEPAAVLLTTLARAAATIGTTPHLLVGDTRHYARLYAVVVGASSRARKGTSTSPVRRIFDDAHRAMAKVGFPGGLPLSVTPGPLSSGEGLVYAVRDPSDETDDDGNPRDPGVEDKRLLVVDGEFGSVLRVAKREGNTLSSILRTAWDDGNIAPLTKYNRIRATDAHINFIAHITQEELRFLLASTEIWNGFANRILWGCVRRTKRIPISEPMADTIVAELARRLASILRAAWGRERVDFSPEARDKWCGIYDTLTEDRPGAYGVVTARAEAQTVRLALLYSLLDPKATEITPDHLRAALAVWDYCDQSARYIFDEISINLVERRIAEALRKQDLSQTEISNLLNRNVPQAQIASALGRLETKGQVHRRTEGGGQGKGRPRTIWSWVRAERTKKTNLRSLIFQFRQFRFFVKKG